MNGPPFQGNVGPVREAAPSGDRRQPLQEAIIESFCARVNGNLRFLKKFFGFLRLDLRLIKLFRQREYQKKA